MTQGLYIWSKTAASNSNADTSINWAEGQAPSSVNDSARAMMARLAEYRDDNSGSLTTGGILTAYTLTTNEVFDSLAHMDKQKFTVVFNVTSGATPTLSVDTLTAKPLRITTGTAPPTGVFIAGTPYTFTYYNTAGEFLQEGAALGTSVVANANLANMAAWTLKGNNTSGSAGPTDFTIDALTAKASPLVADEVPIWDAAGAAMKKATFTAIAALVLAQGTAPTVQRFTSGSNSYTTPVGVARIKVRMCGPGGGGGAASTNAGSNGAAASSFAGWTANPGNGGGAANALGGTGGSGGANGTGTLVARFPGGSGGSGQTSGAGSLSAGCGGVNPFGGGGGSGGASGNPGFIGTTNTGGGGGGGATASSGGGGGGSGEYVEFWMTAAQIGAGTTAVVGGAGTGGTAGGAAGGNGAAGIIIVEEFYI